MPPERAVLTLKPSDDWLPTVEGLVRGFAASKGYPPVLAETLAGLALEACGNLARAVDVNHPPDDCHITLRDDPTALILDIDFSDKIPLAPPPAKGGDPAAPGASDWTRCRTGRVDKVFYKSRGSRRVLTLVFYHRQPGREGELWVMRLVPKLAQAVALDVRPPEGEFPAAGLICNPFTNRVLTLGPNETFVVQHIDGKRSYYDIYLEHIDQIGLVSPDVLAGLHESLVLSGMLDTADPRAEKFKPSLARRILNPNFSIPNADAVVEAIFRRLGFLTGPVGAALLIAIGLFGVYAFASGPATLRSASQLQSFFETDPLALVFLYLLMLATTVIHEFGHALACKRFGGRVHRLGIMFYLVMFIFYCDTTASSLFPKPSQRIMVSLAGPLTTFACQGLGFYFVSLPAANASTWAYVWESYCLMALFCLAMNFAPFIKMDSYYMLMDALDMPNLRERSFAYLGRKIFGRLSQKARRPSLPEPNARERRVFWLYGTVSTAFSLFFVVYSLHYYGSRLVVHASDYEPIWAAIVLVLILSRLAGQAYRKYYALRHWENRLK